MIPDHTTFDIQKDLLFSQLGDHKKMVLSTSAENKVSSRMVSVIILDTAFYLQTDRTMRKFTQLQTNPYAALCFENTQIEGICSVVGRPCKNSAFIALYRKYFPHAYTLYTGLPNEILVKFSPNYLKRWLYEGEKPYEEIFDFSTRTYLKNAYFPE